MLRRMHRTMCLGSVVLLALVASGSAFAETVCSVSTIWQNSDPNNPRCGYPILAPNGRVGKLTVKIAVLTEDGACVPLVGASPDRVLLIPGECTFYAVDGTCTHLPSIPADRPTDETGTTTFTVKSVGGCCDNMLVEYNGQSIAEFTLKTPDYLQNGKVGLDDLSELANTYRKMPGQVGYNECFNLNCDSDGVNLTDLSIFASAYGLSCGVPQTAGPR